MLCPLGRVAPQPATSCSNLAQPCQMPRQRPRQACKSPKHAAREPATNADDAATTPNRGCLFVMIPDVLPPNSASDWRAADAVFSRYG